MSIDQPASPENQSSDVVPVAAQPLAPAVALPRFPLVTTILLGAIGILFACELIFAVGPIAGMLNPGVMTLMAFGGLQYPLVVDDGEWYRLLSAPMLHLDIFHILFNSVALYLAGRVLEPMVGRLWFTAIYALGGIAGGLMSLALNAHNIVSVGASGAIMALFAAMLVLSLHIPAGADRQRMQKTAIQVLIPSLLPLTGAATGAHVDYGAHFAGAIAGVVLGGVLLALWRAEMEKPPLQAVAGGVAVLAIVALGWSAVANARQYHVFALGKNLIPESQLAGNVDALVARAPALVKEFPHDPRSHLYAAIADARVNDLKGAEAEVRTALSEQDMLRYMLKPAFKTHLEAYLALILSDEKRPDDARDMARSGCADASAALHPNLVKAGLCPDQKS
jgi:rhomboid protease GluP